ncbi:hypothetical protein GpartN1_g51.t1 [Galdieria partita]|uniref:N6-adenine-specific methylase n=1 Tax=Galdieria partita TaxID=83374 RepID=A0A9C7UM09_9RHOD|nr:hypothetical protein GpartN1_g51.t1 [Galdieria partita]
MLFAWSTLAPRLWKSVNRTSKDKFERLLQSKRKRNVSHGTIGRSESIDFVDVKNVKACDLNLPRKVHASRKIMFPVKKTVYSQGKRIKMDLPPPRLYVNAGSVKGRRLLNPPVYIRPMMSKVRSALFCMLTDMKLLRPEYRILDIFAGTGAVGIEALSQNVGKAVFVDSSADCCATVRENLERCRFSDRGDAFCSTYEDFVENPSRFQVQGTFELVTLTPPYEEIDYNTLMSTIATSNLIGPGSVVVVEYPIELGVMPPVIMDRLVGLRNRRYGRTVLGIYGVDPQSPLDPRPEEFEPKKGTKLNKRADAVRMAEETS